MSAPEQRAAFESALADAMGGECSLDVVQGVHERLTTKILEHKESKDPEPLTVSTEEVRAILQDCEVPAERAEAFQKSCDEQFGKDAALNPANLINAKKIQLTSGKISLSVDPDAGYLIETRVLNGRRVLIVPIEDDLEFNGLRRGRGENVKNPPLGDCRACCMVR